MRTIRSARHGGALRRAAHAVGLLLVTLVATSQSASVAVATVPVSSYSSSSLDACDATSEPVMAAVSVYRDGDFFIPERLQQFEEANGVAHWPMGPEIATKGFITSWVTKRAEFDTDSPAPGDALAVRFFAAKPRAAEGIEGTPPSVSLAYFSDATKYAYTSDASLSLDPLLRVVDGGAFDEMQTLSITNLFEWTDIRKTGGPFNETEDPVLQNLDLADMEWETPCTSLAGNTSASSDTRFLNFTSSVTSLTSNLTLEFELTTGTGESGGTLRGSHTQTLVLGGFNMLLSVKITNWPYVQPSTSYLALNFTVLTARRRVTNPTEDEEKQNVDSAPRFLDVSGASGKAGGSLPTPVWNNKTGVWNTFSDMRNVMSSGFHLGQMYVAWNYEHEVPLPHQLAPAPLTIQPKATPFAALVSAIAPMLSEDSLQGLPGARNYTLQQMRLSTPVDATIEALRGASRTMFLNSSASRSEGLRVDTSVSRFFVAFGSTAPVSARLVLSIGVGPIPMPGEDPLTDQTNNYIIIGVCVGMFLILAAACLVYSKRIRHTPGFVEKEDKDGLHSNLLTHESPEQAERQSSGDIDLQQPIDVRMTPPPQDGFQADDATSTYPSLSASPVLNQSYSSLADGPQESVASI